MAKALIIVLAIVVLAVVYSQLFGRGMVRRLSAELASQGWYLYTGPTDADAGQAQLAVLGGSYTYNVVCGAAGDHRLGGGPLRCEDTAQFPTWANASVAGGKAFPGFRDIKQLKDLIHWPEVAS